MEKRFWDRANVSSINQNQASKLAFKTSAGEQTVVATVPWNEKYGKNCTSDRISSHHVNAQKAPGLTATKLAVKWQ